MNNTDYEIEINKAIANTDFLRALRVSERAIFFYPDILDFKRLRAECYNFLGNYKAAQKIYKSLLESFPDDEALLAGLGASYYLSQNYQKAIPYLKRALKECKNCRVVAPLLRQSYAKLH